MILELWKGKRTVEVSDEDVETLKGLGHTLQHYALEEFLELCDEHITKDSKISDGELQEAVDRCIEENIRVRAEIIDGIYEMQERGEI